MATTSGGRTAPAAGGAAPTGATPTGVGALDALLAGNRRFVQGEARRQAPGPRPALAAGQSPVAVILCCSDSRVVPEILFDQDLGELFVVRVAGNTADDPVLLGSIEYGVAELGTPLLLVLGHERCGAVTAALDHLEHGTALPGAVGAVVEPVLPAARAAHGAAPGPAEGRLDQAVRENVRRQVALLGGSPAVLAPAVAAGRLLVAGAHYSLATGEVTLV